MERPKRNIIGLVKRAYGAYFGMKLGDQDKQRAPHIVCATCVDTLRKWTNGKHKLTFGGSMVRREPKDHFQGC